MHTWHNCYKAISIALISMTCSYTNAAVKHQPAGSIIKAAEQFVIANTAIDSDQTLQVKANPLDPRLKLPLCSKPLEAFLSHGKLKGKNRTVGVRCNSERPWKIFVPVKVKLLSPALVLTRRVNPGDTLSADDVTLQTRDISTLSYGHYSKPATINGYTAKRALANGTLLSPNMLKAPLLVKRGQTVTISASSGSLNIKMNGQAMSDGSLGQLIRVKNLNSGRIVEGTVQKNGSIKINF